MGAHPSLASSRRGSEVPIRSIIWETTGLVTLKETFRLKWRADLHRDRGKSGVKLFAAAAGFAGYCCSIFAKMAVSTLPPLSTVPTLWPPVARSFSKAARPTAAAPSATLCVSEK
jgi:hypothetical protein